MAQDCYIKLNGKYIPVKKVSDNNNDTHNMIIILLQIIKNTYSLYKKDTNELMQEKISVTKFEELININNRLCIKKDFTIQEIDNICKVLQIDKLLFFDLIRDIQNLINKLSKNN